MKVLISLAIVIIILICVFWWLVESYKTSDKLTNITEQGIKLTGQQFEILSSNSATIYNNINYYKDIESY